LITPSRPADLLAAKFETPLDRARFKLPHGELRRQRLAGSLHDRHYLALTVSLARLGRLAGGMPSCTASARRWLVLQSRGYEKAHQIRDHQGNDPPRNPAFISKIISTEVMERALRPRHTAPFQRLRKRPAWAVERGKMMRHGPNTASQHRADK